ncbi:MAG: inositol monophosphatase family protein [Candidatus Zixiibacteriota bacterium]
MMSEYMKVALSAIKDAEKITLAYYGRHPRVQDKADGSPVTIADKKAEKAIVARIQTHFPDHAFYGEEYGRTKQKSDYLWLIDPIDGTKNFIAQIPLWGNLLALMYQDEIILGISNVPLMRELLWAEKGKGAFLNGKRVHVSRKRRINQSMLSFSSLTSFDGAKKETGMLKLIHQCRRSRSFGDLWAYHLLASGKLEMVIEGKIKPMDVAPFVRIITEAGGDTSDLKGKPFDLRISSFLATNGLVHRDAIQYTR